MRVLVVEDSRRLAGIIKRGLLEEGYAVDNAYDGEEAEFMAETTPFDLVVLDIMLPKKDGLAVCRDLRAKGVHTPILMLTAKDSVEDKVTGLDTGADDYLVKPFAFSELLARLRALLRREVLPKAQKVQVGNLTLDPQSREVWHDGAQLDLTAKEYAILEYFMRRPNAVVTRTMLGESVWDYEFDGLSNIIDVYVRRLRKKIDRDGEASLIQTVRGAGYRLRLP
ncbi:MAG TPA: response regulator transcription factor [Candidatus Aminicenantes bacterium]|nr:response regulator transcription factor [Candidatus Aminicenantes bacterium]HRY64831.1 response regulator transcription factor [Candidatus Aminicenantes bacterium]HRZ71744.1 response regulator transcription factor [Candidatus Aminicenantes bacterium]